MLYNPYLTTLGLHINVKKLSVTISKFITLHPNIRELSYEFQSPSDVQIVFITGKNDAERDLPIWNHPLIIEFSKHERYVVVDMRAYVKIKSEDIVDITQYATIGGGFMYNIVRAFYTAVAASEKEDYGMITALEKTISMGFTRWVANSFVKAMNLGPERMRLQVVVLHYILCLLQDQELNEDNSDVIMFKITRYLPGAATNIKFVKEVLKDINLNPREVIDLVENITTVMDMPRFEGLTPQTFYTIIAGTWLGPNNNEAIAMSCEHVPTLIAVIYSAIDPKGFKYSRLNGYLSDNARENSIKDFLKTVNLTIKEHTITA